MRIFGIISDSVFKIFKFINSYFYILSKIKIFYYLFNDKINIR